MDGKKPYGASYVLKRHKQGELAKPEKHSLHRYSNDSKITKTADNQNGLMEASHNSSGGGLGIKGLESAGASDFSLTVKHG
jgi:phosphoribosylformylglycinamidine (FGAM) synthase-like enzyme|tara:strand:- start:105 stop:347 length:243 start_codon:yes stop_codon:yes gene_type:complete